jgi:hypothetical protein
MMLVVVVERNHDGGAGGGGVVPPVHAAELRHNLANHEDFWRGAVEKGEVVSHLEELPREKDKYIGTSIVTWGTTRVAES